jgi:hypothetical protein
MSEIKVDTVAEKTSANGVTVDGLNIKDSKLVTANSVITSNITDANITTAKIADVNVTEGKIADNAITLAKMASGTDGNIISYDASGNPVAIATGNDGQVLTSTGAGSPPAFEAIPAGGKILQIVSTGDVGSLSQASTNSTSFSDINNVELAFTPTASSSKLIIFLSYNIDSGGDSHGLAVRLMYNHSGISHSEVDDRYGQSNTEVAADRINVWQAFNYYLAPNTTNEITFNIQIAAATGSQTSYFNRGTARIIAMEYA